MGKFIIIQDMRQLPCYKNVNARLLYLHVAMGCDIATYTYVTSLRRLASELYMTVDTVRHALKVLERDGLITPQTTPQGTPQGTPQRTPHLTILKINKNGTPNGTPSTTPNPTPNPTESTNDKNNKKQEEESPTHDVRVRAQACACAVGALGLTESEAGAMWEAFTSRQRLKRKAWSDDGDKVAHFISWAEKRLPMRQNGRKSARQADEDARQAEYERTKQEAEAKDEDTKLREEYQRLVRYYNDFKKRGDTNGMKEVADAITTIKEKYQKRRKEYA